MKCFFLCLIFYANTVAALGYQLKNGNQFKGAELYEISNELKTIQLTELDLTRVGKIRPFLFDQIFVDSVDARNYAVVILDLAYHKKVLKLSGQQMVCHAMTKSGRAFAIYFSDKKMAKTISFCQDTSNKNSLIKFFIPHARADLCETEPKLVNNLVTLRKIAFEQKDLVVQKVGSCLSQSLQGMHSAIPDGTLITTLLTKPEVFWDSVSEQAKALKNFIMTISSEMKTLVKNFKALDGELVMNLVCQKAGQVLVEGLAVGGGVALAPKLALALVKTAASLKHLKDVFSRLNQLKHNGRIDLANGILSCGT